MCSLGMQLIIIKIKDGTVKKYVELVKIEEQMRNRERRRESEIERQCFELGN